MAKILVKKEELKKHLLEKDLHNFLENKYKTFVLVTCTDEDAKGNMQVEMKYKGDEDLLSYLLEGASQEFEREDSEIKKDSL